MKTTTAFSLLAAAGLALSSAAFAAGKDYQVTGPILEVNDSMIAVQKGQRSLGNRARRQYQSERRNQGRRQSNRSLHDDGHGHRSESWQGGKRRSEGAEEGIVFQSSTIVARGRRSTATAASENSSENSAHDLSSHLTARSTHRAFGH